MYLDSRWNAVSILNREKVYSCSNFDTLYQTKLNKSFIPGLIHTCLLL